VTGTSLVVSPTTTTTYTLTAQNSAGTVTAQCTVTVVAPPAIASFSASPATINVGQSATLSWSTSGTDCSLTISPGVGAVTGASSCTVSPTTTTTYTLTAINNGGSQSSQVTIYVILPPSNVTLTATPAVISGGQATTLTWSVDGSGYSLSLAPGIGSVTGTSLVVNPAGTTTYTLTATNGSGSATASALVTVNLPPVLGVMPTLVWTVDKQDSFTLPAATDPNGLTINYQVAGLPRGLSFNGGTRAVSGMIGAVGNYSFQYTATNSLGLAVSTMVNMCVGARPQSQLGVATTIQYTYQNDGLLATITYPSTNVATYGYDALSRVNSVQVNGVNVVSTIQYDDWSRMSFMGFPSGAADQWTYDPSGKLKQWTLGTNGAMPQTWCYDYDAADRLILAGEWTDLRYDANNRLKVANAPTLNISASYDYDAFSNNISNSGRVPNPFQFVTAPNNLLGLKNQLPGAAYLGYSYANYSPYDYGEMTSIAPEISSGESRGFLWNSFGMLTQVPMTAAGYPDSVETYSYEASGYRVTRVDSVDPTLNRVYAYSGAGSLMSEFAALGSMTWNRDVIYVGGRAVAEIDATYKLHELHSDHLGSPRVITSFSDPSGQIEGSQVFDPYGVRISYSGYVPLTGFTGHIQSEPNGLIYMRGRYYYPAWHCFLNSDQGADSKQWSRYAYAGGNPLMNSDPSGMSWLSDAIGDVRHGIHGLGHAMGANLGWHDNRDSFAMGAAMAASMFVPWGVAEIPVIAGAAADGIFIGGVLGAAGGAVSGLITGGLDGFLQGGVMGGIGAVAVYEACQGLSAMSNFALEGQGYQQINGQWMNPGEYYDYKMGLLRQKVLWYEASNKIQIDLPSKNPNAWEAFKEGFGNASIGGYKNPVLDGAVATGSGITGGSVGTASAVLSRAAAIAGANSLAAQNAAVLGGSAGPLGFVLGLSVPIGQTISGISNIYYTKFYGTIPFLD
jgi:RHS repeat-associated protein